METPPPQPELRRSLSLIWLVFYGLGVTIGAGIFALIGEIMRVAGEQAPLSFLSAGIIAGATGLSYALLVRVYPRAGGEVIFVNNGLGRFWGRLTGYAIIVTAVVSSAVIALAFAGYASTFIPLPEPLMVVLIVSMLAFIAWWGVRESVAFAAAITVLEVGTLAVIIAFGAPQFLTLETARSGFALGGEPLAATAVLTGAILAFFAFVGFEDLENMAEETLDPARTLPRAILWTLGITVFLYVSLALVAVGALAEGSIAGSRAPLADLFELITPFSGEPVAAIATIAMVNGILVQIVMAARVLYGMSREGQMPAMLGRIDPRHRTPVVATPLVAIIIIILALTFPLVSLAELTSLVVITVFTMVNLSLFVIGRRHEDRLLRRFHWWGLVAAAMCIAILVFQVSQGVIAGH